MAARAAQLSPAGTTPAHPRFGTEPVPTSASPEERPLDTIRTVDVVISGRVQGVGYRYWTIGQAEQRGLSGHVRNRADGSVEARFSGAPDRVASILDACWVGPPEARVASVVVTESAETVAAGFHLLRN